jgi:hypothetical protein
MELHVSLLMLEVDIKESLLELAMEDLVKVEVAIVEMEVLLEAINRDHS